MLRLLTLLLICLSFGSYAQQPQTVDFKKVGAPFPPIRLELTSSGAIVNNSLIKPKKPLMLMIFSPECDHCVHMIDSIKAISSSFKQTQFLLVAENRNKHLMADFVKKAGIGSLPLFANTGVDKGNLIYYTYTQKILPQVNFYDANLKLIKTFDGNTYSLDSLKPYIK